MIQWDYSPQCPHTAVYRIGFRDTLSRGPAQRWRCQLCKQTWLEGRREVDRVKIGRALLVPGATIAGVAREMGYHRRTVRRVAKILVGHRPPCGCGKPAGHRGGRCGR